MLTPPMSSLPQVPAQPPQGEKGKKLLDQVRDVIRIKHYSTRTEESYADWIKRYILFHNKRHPLEMGKVEIQAFITYLATERHLSASSQNQALSAILFLYRHVLEKNIEMDNIALRAVRPDHLPTVLTKDEAMSVINQMQGTYKLMTQLLYGDGLRLTPALAPERSAGASVECLRLRVKDVDFGNHQIIVRDGKGEKDRIHLYRESKQWVPPLAGYFTAR